MGAKTAGARMADEFMVMENRRNELLVALQDLVNACLRYDERPDSGVAHVAYMQAMDKARAALVPGYVFPPDGK